MRHGLSRYLGLERSPGKGRAGAFRVLAGGALLLAVLVGCAPRSSPDSRAAASAAAPADTLLTLSRSTCYGPCPSYDLTVFADGRVVYVGKEFVEQTDTVRAQIDSAQVARLVERFEEAGYFDYERGYGRSSPECTAFRTDYPTVRTSFRWSGRRQSVQHYRGCYVQPSQQGDRPRRADRLARLAALEDTVDRIVGTERWTGVEREE